MPSTYTLNNGIELIGTGEQSGTWGDTTNTNLELLDTALDGQVTVTLTSAGTSGSPNDLPISDGAASDGRNRMVIFNDGGDLGATAYVQLTPNDAEKIIYVRNDLAGSRSIILFQGTYNASNDYEVPAGTTAVIYFDGAGSGAVAANVFNNAYFDSLRLGSVSVTAILDEDDMSSDSATSLATQQSIKAYVDSQVGTVDTWSEVLANGNTSGATDAVITAGQKITTDTVDETTAAAGVTVDGVLLKDGGATLTGDLTVDTDTLYVDSTNDRVGIGTSSPSRSLHISGGTNSMVIERTDATTSALLLVAESNTTAIYSRASNASTTARDLAFNMGSTEAMRIDSSGQVGIGTSSPSELLHVQSSGDTKLKVETTGTTAASGHSGLSLNTGNGGYLLQNLTTVDSTHGVLRIYDTTNSAERMRIDSSGNVGIGTSSPSYKLHVRGADATSNLVVGNTTEGTQLEVLTYQDDRVVLRSNDTSNTARTLAFENGTSEAMRIDSSGNVGIGTTSPTATKLQINYTAASENGLRLIGTNTAQNNALLMYDASNNYITQGINAGAYTLATNGTERMRITSSGSVGIGTSSPLTGLYGTVNHISGTSGGIILSSSASTFGIGSVAGVLQFYDSTNASERMRIDSSGNLLVGTTTNYTKLTVSNGPSTRSGITISDTNTASLMMFAGNAGSAVIGTDVNGLVIRNGMTVGTDNGTEIARFDSSGNLLVGTTNDVAHVTSSSGEGISLSSGSYGGFIGASRNGDVVVALNRQTNNGDILRFYQGGNAVGSVQARAGVVSTIILDPRTAGAGFTGAGDGVSSRHIVGTNQSGTEVDGEVSLGKSGVRFKDLYLSGGVYLGGTGAANQLDDYEEGTWTPTFTSTGTNPTVTYGTRHASYRKVGSLVTIFIDMTISSYTGGTGNGTLGGLPFSQSGDARGVVSGRSTNGITYSNGFQLEVIGGISYFSEDASSDIPLSDFSTGGFRVIMGGSYTTA